MLTANPPTPLRFTAGPDAGETGQPVYDRRLLGLPARGGSGCVCRRGCANLVSSAEGRHSKGYRGRLRGAFGDRKISYVKPVF